MKNLHVIMISKKYVLSFVLLTLLIVFSFTYIYRMNFVHEMDDFISMPIYYGNVDYSDIKEEKTGGKLAIIIDDFGQSRDGVKEMMKIGRHLTFAVMPFLQFSQVDAEEGYEKGYEI